MEALSDSGLAGRVRVVGVPDRFLPAGSADDVIEHVGLDADSLVERVSVQLRSLG
jgi:transketolase C-terminal domain/subunit